MTSFALGSFFNAEASSSRIALASLSTRHGMYRWCGRCMNWIGVRALHCGGGGGASTVTVEVQVPVKPRESVAVTVIVTGPLGKPVLSNVAVVPVPVTVPAEAW